MRFFFTFIPPTEFAEDSPHTSADKGVQSLAVQKATPADISSEGDYSPQQVSGGRTWTSAKIDTALPAGTNAIGKLAANDGVDIGDVTVNNASGASAVNIQDGGNSITVDGSVTVTQATGTNLHTVLDSGTLTTLTTLSGTTSLTPGTGATNLGKAEDAAHTTGDVGVMMLAVRNDDGSVIAGSNGDYLPLTTDSSGALRIDLNGTVSSNNSSTATLTANSVFTGTSEDCLIYNEIRVSVISDVASATNGLSLQQSQNNTNWDITDTYTISAATAATFSVPRQARYFRLVYTNGGTNQASFRLQTILNRMGTSAQSQRASDGYTNETDLGQNQSFNMVYNGTTWDRVRGDITNGLDVDVTRLPALVAGTAVIGKVSIDQTTPGTTNLVALAANQSVNLAQVAGATVQTGSGTASGAQRVELANNGTGTLATISTVTAFGIGTSGPMKAEDSASGNGDQLVGMAVRRKDTPVANAQVTSDEDYLTPITDNFGKLWVTGTYVEDTAHTTGDIGTFAMGVGNEAQTALAADGDYMAHAVDTKGNTMQVGNIAHDGVDAGNPVKIGGKAVSAEPAAVSAADRANFITDLVGKLIVLPYANPENFVSGAITSAMTGTTTTSLIAAPASGLRNYITTIICSNSHATVGTDIIIQDGSGGTTLLTIPAAAVYGGAVITLPTPLRQPTTATAIFCTNVTTGASTKVSAVGYKGI